MESVVHLGEFTDCWVKLKNKPLTISCTLSGRFLYKQSDKCLLISNEGENGPRAPSLASVQRFSKALAASPETFNNQFEGGLRSPPSHRYQSPPPTWRQQRGSLPKPLTPAEGNSDLPGVRLTHLGCEDMRSESLETAHHSEVVEAEEAAASKGQVEHVESWCWHCRLAAWEQWAFIKEPVITCDGGCGGSKYNPEKWYLGFQFLMFRFFRSKYLLLRHFPVMFELT